MKQITKSSGTGVPEQGESQVMDMLNIKQALRYITWKDARDCVAVVVILLALRLAEFYFRAKFLPASIGFSLAADTLIGWICATKAITWRDKYKSEISGQTKK